jgi:hypothetical protein
MAFFVFTTVDAEPWIAPGDVALRHELQMLSDAGLIRSPLSTWPNSWPQIARELLAVDDARVPARYVPVLERVRARARRATRSGDLTIHARAAVAPEPTPLRTFDSTPREEGELELAADYMGRRFAFRLAATAVADASDGKTVRPDGSYLGVILGNWILSAGYLDQWWGPGWDGSLLLSTSARPIPSLAIERNYADPFASRWLSWIGPWRLSFRIGELEGDRADFAHTRFFAMRVNFRPIESLEIGLSRSAQFCGDGRPCGFSQFWDLFIGNDNDQPLDEQPGNQLAGFDARYTLPGSWARAAIYAQMIGEDEAGLLPSKYLGLFGIETWGSVFSGTWRAHFEYADTACNFSRTHPQFGCAYDNVIYTDGYNYRHRSIGHAMGGDGRMYSLGGLYVDGRGDSWSLLARSVELNRAGASNSHPITLQPADLWNIEFSLTSHREFGTIRAGLGYDDVDEGIGSPLEDEFRGFVEWSREF